MMMMINMKVKENLHLRQLVGSFLPHSSKEGEAVDEEDEQGIFFYYCKAHDLRLFSLC